MLAHFSAIGILVLAYCGGAAACGGLRQAPCPGGTCTYKPYDGGRSAPNGNNKCVECGTGGKPICTSSPACVSGFVQGVNSSGDPICKAASTPPPGPTPPAPPAGSLPGAFAHKASDCHATTSILGTPVSNAQIHIKPAVRPSKFYDQYSSNWKLPLPYPLLGKGKEFCDGEFSKASEKKIDIGGTVAWNKNNKCYLPPTKANGDSCCTIKFWQPDGAGYYHSYCSAKQSLGADGVYWLKTVVPGDENDSGWGPDNAGHIHYQVDCAGCQTSSAFPGTSFDGTAGLGDARGLGANKFYTGPVCSLTPGCMAAAGKEHQATEISPNVWRYPIVL